MAFSKKLSTRLMGTAAVVTLLAVSVVAQREAGGHDRPDHSGSQTSNGANEGRPTYGAHGERPDPGVRPDPMGNAMIGGAAGGLVGGIGGSIAGRASGINIGGRGDSGRAGGDKSSGGGKGDAGGQAGSGGGRVERDAGPKR